MNGDYDELLVRLGEISDLGRARALLAWDERTYMPPGGGEARAEQLATLTRARHERLSSDELGLLLDRLRPETEAMPYDSDEASMVKGTSEPSDWAMPIAMAVFPVLGGPAIRTARPAILPSCAILRMTAAALRAFSCPTRPCDETFGSSVSGSTPRPRMCECAATRLRPRSSLLSAMVVMGCAALAETFSAAGAHLRQPLWLL